MLQQTSLFWIACYGLTVSYDATKLSKKGDMIHKPAVVYI